MFICFRQMLNHAKPQNVKDTVSKEMFKKMSEKVLKHQIKTFFSLFLRKHTSNCRQKDLM